MYTLAQIEELKKLEEENRKLKERVAYLEKVMYDDAVDNEDYRSYSLDDRDYSGDEFE